MGSRDLLVDSNVVIDFFAGDEKCARLIDEAGQIFIPVTVVGELLAGARRSLRPEHNVRTLETFMERGKVLPCDRATASHFADIQNDLRARGRPIPENDMWIAAVAQQHGLTLASRDGHFDEVRGLLREPCRD